MAGYALAPDPFNIYSFTCLTVGTSLCSGAANSFNQVHCVVLFLENQVSLLPGTSLVVVSVFYILLREFFMHYLHF